MDLELDQNAETIERWATGITGGLLTGLGLYQKSIPGLALAAAGGFLLYRAKAGHVPIYTRLVKDPETTLLPADEPLPQGVEEGDEVLEASWESFPTSDAPGWTLGREREER